MHSVSQVMDPCTRSVKPCFSEVNALTGFVPALPPNVGTTRSFRERAAKLLSSLTPRQSLVLDHILAGRPSKTIAFHLHISQRTVENHRAAIAKKMGARSLSALLHSAICGKCFLEEECRLIDGAGATPAFAKARPLTLLQPSPRAQLTGPSHTDTAGLDLAEIQHRLKNIVAVVQSLSNQTLRQSKTKEEFSERFTARLGAYCRSLDLLTATNWSEVGLNALVQAQLQSFGIHDSKQITAHGDEILLSPAVANSIGLALHELATNAVKYGALSSPTGKVRVTWTVIDNDGFRLSWCETGGPVVTAPQHRGFGRRLLEDLAALAVSGQSTCAFKPSGVAWTFEFPATAKLAA